MIPDGNQSNGSRQDFIDLLCRITKSDEATDVQESNGHAQELVNSESEIIIIESQPNAEEGEIITIDDDEEDANSKKKEVEDGELSESPESDTDDVEELNLRLYALRSLAGAKKQRREKVKKSKPKKRRSNDYNRYGNDDTDLRSSLKSRSSSRYFNQSSHNDDREYLLDKDYRQLGVYDMLVSLISPDRFNRQSSNNGTKLLDNYDIQHMDIVDDHLPSMSMSAPPLPLMPPAVPPPLPPNHLPFFDPLPPLPPPPPSLFNIIPGQPTFPVAHWPRPNFVQQTPISSLPPDHWPTSFTSNTDIDLRHPLINNHSHSIPMNTDSFALKQSQPKRKRPKKSSRKHRREHPSSSVLETNTDAPPVAETPTTPPLVNDENIHEEDDENERLLREELLRTLSGKRKVKIIENKPPEPDRIVTIVSSASPPPLISPPVAPAVVNVAPVVNKSVEITTNKSQYTVNQRYKRVKASTSLTTTTTTVVSKTETATVRTATQPIIQTRNKIVRGQDADADAPQSNSIIIKFDEQTTDEDDDELPVKKTSSSTFIITDEEHQAIKRLPQLQEEMIRRTNAIDLNSKTTAPKPVTPAVEVPQEAPPSTDELSAVFEKRRMLLNERAKYHEIQEKMKKKKLDNGLLARELERLEEQLLTKKTQVTKNNALLAYWEKEAMSIAQNIRQQGDLILQSAVFKSVKPMPTPVAKLQSPIEFDWAAISKVFQDNARKMLLSILICPWRSYRQLRPYRRWFNTISKKITELPVENHPNLLLRTRSYTVENPEQYWKACLQAYLIDVNQILCPYELQGSCKAQHCIYQHQYQINQRIEQCLPTKTIQENDKQKLLAELESVCSMQSFDLDLSIFKKQINERQYQRCRTKLDRYLAIYHEDFRYFRDASNNESNPVVHPSLVSVSKQLDSDDFSLERAVAELVEGLESQRTNAQLWCLYLEFSSWHMSDVELHPLCAAALKNAQSYDLFWTIFYLCANNLEDFIDTYATYLQSDEFEFSRRSYAICELAMFHASLAPDSEHAYQRVYNHLANASLTSEHRIYLALVLLYTFAFGAFPSNLYQHIDEHRFSEHIDLEPFVCPWYALTDYAHSTGEIDQLFNELIHAKDLSETSLALAMNRMHYFNATKRYEQSKVYIETLLESFPSSIELWIEYLLSPTITTEISVLLERATQATGSYYELIYALSSSIKIEPLLEKESMGMKTSREKLFSDLCHLLLDTSNSWTEKKIDESLLRYNGELRGMIIVHVLDHLSQFSIDVRQRLISKLLVYLIPYDDQDRVFMLYSFFRLLPLGRVLDIVIDCFLSHHSDQYEWILQPFTNRLLDLAVGNERNTLVWIRLDAFVKQWVYTSDSPEIYVTLLQRLLMSTDEKSKIARLCRLFEKQYPNCGFISSQLRQLIFQSTTTTTSVDVLPS